jgi:hypothetical protein
VARRPEFPSPSDVTKRRALGHAVADLHEHLGDRARGRGRDVHRRLVGLERDERILGGDGVADATRISITGTSSKSPMSGRLRDASRVIRSSASAPRGRSRTLDRLLRRERLDRAVVGERLQRGDGDVVAVDLEEAAQVAR